MNKEEFILKASDLLKWEESLEEREDEVDTQYRKLQKEAYERASLSLMGDVEAANKTADQYKLALKREQKAHAETRLDLKRSMK